MNRLIAILLILFSSNLLFAQEQTAIIFKWEMNVYEVPIDGVFHKYDTLVVWGVKQDTIAYNFSDRRLVFFDVSRQVWARHTEQRRADIEHHIAVLKMHDEADPNHRASILLKQDRYNELYIIRFIYGESGVSIFVFNCVFGTPTYVFKYISPCKICLED